MSDEEREQTRELRVNYRNLIVGLEGEQAGADSSDVGLIQSINQANDLFENVHQTQEASLDSKFILTAGRMVMERAKGLKIGGSSFNRSDFLTRITRKMTVNEELDWTSVYGLVGRHLLRSPDVEFMLGPLAVSPKAVKERKISKKDDLVKIVRKPQELHEEDIEKQENETSANVQGIYLRLHELGRINLFQFVINPNSFGQSVENLFYLSFLVKEGKVEIDVDDDTGETFVAVLDNEDAEEEGESTTTQLILTIDQPLWKEAIELYKIKNCCIPNREPKIRSTTSKGWY